MSDNLGLNGRQLKWARQVVAAVEDMHLPGDEGQRAADITLAACLVETNLTMYANGNNAVSLRLPHDAVGWDHGSVGLLQQQVGGAPNSTANWGTTKQCMNVEYSVHHFVRVLRSRNWKHMTNGEAAQSVQGSAFPDRYAARDAQAARIRKALWTGHDSAPAKPPAKPPAKKAPAKKPASGGSKTYTVRRGDTMTAIAKAHHVSLKALEQANPKAGHPDGDFDDIRPGDKLRIP